MLNSAWLYKVDFQSLLLFIDNTHTKLLALNQKIKLRDKSYKVIKLATSLKRLIVSIIIEFNVILINVADSINIT